MTRRLVTRITRSRTALWTLVAVAAVAAAGWATARAAAGEDAAAASQARRSAVLAADQAAAAPTPGCSVNFSAAPVDGSSLWPDIKPKAGQDPRNCDFHAFSWNNFLWLVGDQGGHPRFMSLAPWYQVFPASGQPGPWRGNYQPLQPIEIVKSDVHVLGGEAGDNFQLLDVASQASGYDIRINQPFYDFIRASGLYTKAAVSSAAQDFSNIAKTNGGIWLPPGSASAAGALEIKTAWRQYGTSATACPSSIMHCEKASDGSWWGLVGIHAVQKTPTRGELIWASFEHVANAPDCTQTATVTDPNGNPVLRPDGTPWPGTDPIGKLPSDPVKGGTIATGWNYFDYPTYQKAGGDGKTCTFPDDDDVRATGQQCNTDPTSGFDSSHDPIFQRVDVCRTESLPAVTAANCEVNVANALNVSCLNDSVMASFPAGLATKWRYYRSIGAEWMNATSVPTTGCFTFTPDGPACPQKTTPPYSGYPATFQRAGTQTLANTTMETWMQDEMAGKYQTWDSQNDQPTLTVYEATDCFGCHQPVTFSFGEGDTSHVFTKTQQ